MANLIDRDNTLKDVIGIRITVPYSKYNTAEEVKAFEEYPATAYITAQNPAFIVEATTRDAAGTEKVFLAWDPNASEEKAVTLKQNVWDIDTNGYHDGVKYWIVDLKDFENVSENNTFKMDWSCELPVGDFTDETGNKVFDYSISEQQFPIARAAILLFRTIVTSFLTPLISVASW